MSLKLVTAKQMRDIDGTTIHERGIPGLELMERAGKAVAETILAQFDPKSVGVVAGKGNNAGDGLVVARLLSEKGVDVRVLMLTPNNNLSEAGKTNYERLSDGVEIFDRHQTPEMSALFDKCDVIVDAILGTGVIGAPRGGMGEAIAVINNLGKPIVAIDLPSGLNADTGEAEGACVQADMTVTIGLPKIGMVRNAGPEVCGHIQVEDIGFPKDLLGNPEIHTHLITPQDAAAALPIRPYDGHKGTFGSLLVIAGSKGMSGAAILSVSSALRSGCGMVYAAFPSNLINPLSGTIFEAVKIPVSTGGGDYFTHEAWDNLEPYINRVSAIALGPGIGTDESTARLVDELVCQDVPMVIDADALNCLGEKVQYLTKREAPTIITPHPGEMSRLTGISTKDIQSNRLETAETLSRASRVTVLLKGAFTVIASPDGNLFVNPTGNNGMAKGGVGDVLTGLIGGLLAQGCGALDAARAGAYLHGLAGDMARNEYGERCMTASDLLSFFPEAFQACSGETFGERFSSLF